MWKLSSRFEFAADFWHDVLDVVGVFALRVSDAVIEHGRNSFSFCSAVSNDAWLPDAQDC